jgi:hypothetical protein
MSVAAQGDARLCAGDAPRLGRGVGSRLTRVGSPSPLNGERAGVRGEAVRLSPFPSISATPAIRFVSLNSTLITPP